MQDAFSGVVLRRLLDQSALSVFASLRRLNQVVVVLVANAWRLADLLFRLPNLVHFLYLEHKLSLELLFIGISVKLRVCASQRWALRG